VGAIPDAPRLVSPSLFIVGEVVALAQTLNDSHVKRSDAPNELSAFLPELRNLMADGEVA